MRLLAQFIVPLAAFCFIAPTSTADTLNTNGMAIVRIPADPSGTNQVKQASDEEVQAKAKEVWHKIIIFGAVVMIGAIVVAGFALYGAYQKFGKRGAIVVAIILTFGVFVVGNLLLFF